jgi:hypothetical protein
VREPHCLWKQRTSPREPTLGSPAEEGGAGMPSYFRPGLPGPGDPMRDPLDQIRILATLLIVLQLIRLMGC